MNGAAWDRLPTAIDAAEARGLLRGVEMPVALTGATGFIGSHLVEALVAAGARVRVLAREPARLPAAVRDRVEVVRGDLDDGAALGVLLTGAATVLHLAGRVRAAGAAGFDRVNRVGTERLVASAATHAPASRLVYVSSLAAAGPSAGPQGVAPGDPARPISQYGRSKRGGELAVQSRKGPWVVVRPPAVYGPRDVDVLQFFRLAARGCVPLPAGERWVSVAHVSDVVRGVLAAAAAGAPSRVVHLGEPAPVELAALIAELARAGGVAARVVRLPAILVRAGGLCGSALQAAGFAGASLTFDKARELLARHWTARTAESMRELGLAGFVPFGDGARETWAWYREQGWVPHAKIRGA